MHTKPMHFERRPGPTWLGRGSAALAALALVHVPWLAHAAPAAEAAEPAAGFDFRQWWNDNIVTLLSDDLVAVGLRMGGALLLFIGGWLVARLISAGIYKGLRSTDLDNKLADKLGIAMLLDEQGRKPGSTDTVERGISRVSFWLLMALVVVAVLDFAGLEQAAGPIQRLVDTVIQALPDVGKAVMILFVAWVAGMVLRIVVSKFIAKVGFDDRLAKLDPDGTSAAEGKAASEDSAEGAAARPFSESVGQVVFWLIMALGLAGAFDALHIQAISGPMSNAINTVMALVPVVGIAILIGLGGYVLSKVVRVIVTRALESLGFDNLIDKIGLRGLFDSSTPSKVVGWLAMALVLLQTAIAALDRVGLETLSVPMTAMVGQMWALLPTLAISILFVILGVFAGRLLRGIVHKALVGVGFDRLMARLGFAQIADRDDDLAKPAGLVAFVVQVVVVLLAIVQALHNLQLDTWAGYVDALLRFAVTRVAVALLIVGIGFLIGNYVRDLIEARQRGEQPTTAGTEGEAVAPREPVWMAEFARYAVLVFAFTMAVQQLGVAEDFVLISFALVFGALCLAGALAFGLGSRELAGEIVRDRYRKAKQPGGSPVTPASGAGPGSSGLFGGIKPPTKPGT